jgi:hypothetical protein
MIPFQSLYPDLYTYLRYLLVFYWLLVFILLFNEFILVHVNGKDYLPVLWKGTQGIRDVELHYKYFLAVE